MRAQNFVKLFELVEPLYNGNLALGNVRIPRGKLQTRSIAETKAKIDAIQSAASKAISLLHKEGTSLEHITGFAGAVDALNGSAITQTAVRRNGKVVSEAIATLLSEEMTKTAIAIANKPNSKITQTDVHVLSLIERSAIPGRPEIPVWSDSYTYMDQAYVLSTARSSHRYASQFNLLRHWRDQRLIGADPANTKESLTEIVKKIVNKPAGDQTHDELRMLSVLQGVDLSIRPEGIATPFGIWESLEEGVPTDDEFFVEILEHIQRNVRGVEIASDPAVTPESVAAHYRRVMAKPSAELAPQDLELLAAVEYSSPELKRAIPRGNIPGTKKNSFFTQIHRVLVADSLTDFDRRILNRLRLDETRRVFDAGGSKTQEVIRDTVQAILAKQNVEITEEDMRILAVIMSLPSGNRPKELRYINGRFIIGLAESAITPSKHVAAEGVVHDMRVAFRRTALLDDQTFTPAQFAETYMSIIRKPDVQLTQEDLMMWSVLETLPNTYRIQLPNGLRKGANYAKNSEDTIYLVRLRLPIVRFDVALADAANRSKLSPEYLMRELSTVLEKTDDQITRDDLMRLAIYEKLSDKFNGHLDVINQDNSHEPHAWRLFFENKLPSDDPEALRVFTLLRNTFLVGTNIGESRIIQQLASDQPISTALIRYLENPNSDGLMQRLPPVRRLEIRLASAFSALSNGSQYDEDEVIRVLTIARKDLRKIRKNDPVTAQLAKSIDGLIQRNIKRLSGDLDDGYLGSPDFADIGRVSPLVSMLKSKLVQTSTIGMPTAPATAVPSAGQLLW